MQAKQNIQKGQKKKKQETKLPAWEVSESAKEKCFQRDGRRILYIVI